nr:hypothetical protein [Clostridia bacterium]
MSKKFSLFTLALVLIMAFSLLSTSVFAGSSDGEFKGLSIDKAKYHSSAEVFGAAPSQRGFAVSYDGKYVFGGFLSGDKAVVKFDAKDYKPLAAYATPNDYPKGITADDRGNLFVGLCNGDQKDYISVAYVNMNTMKEVAKVQQNVGSGKVGVNGIAVYKELLTEEYYLYVVVNYDFQRLYRFNVTDPTKITLDKTFGTGGYVDLETLTGVKGCEGQYLDVDVWGDIFLSMTLGKGGDKADTIIKINSEGKIVDEVDCKEAYYLQVYGEYLATSTYNGADSCVYIFNTSDLTEVAQIKASTSDHSHFAGIAFLQDKIIVGDQSFNGQSGFWQITGFRLPDEEVPVIDDEPADAPAAPATAEPISLALCAIAVLAGGGLVASKKRR